MRRINSEFQTRFLSEEGQALVNRDYFGYAELDDFACYVLADSLDGEPLENSARIVVESLIRSFSERPTMRKGRLERYLQGAHRELKKQRGGMRLKASVVMAVTDYRSVRSCCVGNSRFYLERGSRFLVRTRDQSLAEELTQKGELPKDAAEIYEGRNNLYSYLGERGTPKADISKKIRLVNGDILYLMSRGIWERCSDEKLLELSKDAKEPEEILNQVEDEILAGQEQNPVDNYTLAVTFVDQVYQPPKKRFPIKQVLMAAIPLVLLVGGISLGMYLRHRNVKNREERLERCMESGEEYLHYDNYKKASEEYGEAKKLAEGLKHQEEAKEADRCLKLSEQVLLADEAMGEGEYQKAQELYRKARRLSEEAGNVGRDYLDARMKEAEGYLAVFDLMELGEKREGFGDREGAIEAYREARDCAAALYYSEGKEEALRKQAAVEEAVEKDSQKAKAEKEAENAQADAAKKESQEAREEEERKEKESQEAKEELENQQRVNDQKNAIELENQGNMYLAEGKYESAVTYYRTAQAIYIRLELPELADGINGKLEAAQAGIAARDGAQNGEGAAGEEKERAGTENAAGAEKERAGTENAARAEKERAGVENAAGAEKERAGAGNAVRAEKDQAGGENPAGTGAVSGPGSIGALEPGPGEVRLGEGPGM